VISFAPGIGAICIDIQWGDLCGRWHINRARRYRRWIYCLLLHHDHGVESVQGTFVVDADVDGCDRVRRGATM